MSAEPIPPLSSVVVESFDQTPIHFDLYESSSTEIALVVPGFWRSRRWPTMIELARELMELGYRPVIVDVRGHGDSGGVYGFNLHEHHDVWAVIEWVRQNVDTSAIHLIGFSVGGAIAISTAARHEFPCSGLLLISSVAEFGMISPRINPFTIRRHVALGQAFKRPRFDWHFRTSRKLSTLEDVVRVERPICLIHVKNDWLINHQHSIALYEKANEPKELHIIDVPGNFHADRIFTQLREEIDPIVKKFLRRCRKEETPRIGAAFTESQRV